MPVVTDVPRYGVVFRLPFTPTHRMLDMRVHFSPIVTVYVALVLILGTVGCQNTGGAWYNPKSYTWTNPFSKDSHNSLYSSSKKPAKPSIESRPNVSPPEGGYTSNGSYAGRSAGYSSGHSLDGGQQNLMTAQPSSSPYAGFSSAGAEPSSYPPQYLTGAGGQSYSNQGVTPSSYQQYPTQQSLPSYQYPETQQTHTAQQGTTMPYGGNEYPAGQYQPTAGHTPLYNNYESGSSGNYNPYGTPQPDAYNASAIQQPSMYNAPASGVSSQAGRGNGYDQSSASAPYQTAPASYGNGVSVATPYNPYPPTSGFGSNY